MAIKKVWIGSQGPYLYDDAEDLIEYDPDETTTINHGPTLGITTTSQIRIGEAPSDPDHVVRSDDFLGLLPQGLDTTDSPTFDGLTITGTVTAEGVNTSDRCYLKTPNSAPSDGSLVAAQITFYLNESGNELKVRVKYTDGTTLKTGTVALV